MAILEEQLIEVDVSHVPLLTRIHAVKWCFEEFGYNSVDIWSESPCFRFREQKQATWFILKWL